jgi:hypothetical protein
MVEFGRMQASACCDQSAVRLSATGIQRDQHLVVEVKPRPGHQLARSGRGSCPKLTL